jgi:hypothetical protein
MDDTYDDGLVHSHNWAAEPPAATAGTKLMGAEIAASMSAHPEEDSFDDGLVHGHDWARA